MNSGLGLLKPTTSCLVYFNFYLFIWLRLWAFVSALFSASMFSRPFYFKTQKGKLLYNSLWLAIFALCLLWNNFAFANSETLSLFPVRNRESSRVLSSFKPPSLWRFFTSIPSNDLPWERYTSSKTNPIAIHLHPLSLLREIHIQQQGSIPHISIISYFCFSLHHIVLDFDFYIKTHKKSYLFLISVYHLVFFQFIIFKSIKNS